jgi:hypothetical protein
MEQLGEGGRDADFLLLVGAAGLKQEYTSKQILSQARSQNASR